MVTFLIADDTESKLQMLKALVEESAIATDIRVARTSEEAKIVIDNHAIDAAFIDYGIPTENGPVIIAYLRQKKPEAKIALVSACDIATYNTEALDAGAEACFCTSYAKDRVHDELLGTLAQWKVELEG